MSNPETTTTYTSLNDEAIGEIKELYGNFTKKNFPTDKWDKVNDKWKEYYQKITSTNGLPIEDWLNLNNNSNLQQFLTDDTGELLGSIGNRKYFFIIYENGTGNINYYDIQKKANTSYNYANNKQTIDELYAQKIQQPLKKLLDDLNTKNSIKNIYDNASNEYKNILNLPFVKKIIFLHSLMDDAPAWLKHKFVWIYSNKTIDNLIDILDVNVNKEDTFLVKNHAVYEAAKKIVGFNDNSLDGHNKLYQFLWDLAEGNMSDLMDFNSNSLMFSGAPGTGKTFGVCKGIEKLQNINSKYRDMRYVQFHPVFSYQDFIEGIKPMGITSNGNIDLKVVNGVFKKFCIYVREQNEIYYSALQKNLKLTMTILT